MSPYLPKSRRSCLLLVGLIVIKVVIISTFLVHVNNHKSYYYYNYYSSAFSSGTRKPSWLNDTGTFESVSLEDETFLVNTTTCKIPYFDPWDKMATVNIKRDCDKRPEFNIETICPTRPVRRWAYVDDSVQPTLVMNLTAIHESGYSWNSLRCCYYVIERVEQSLDNYDKNADWEIKVSECQRIRDPIYPMKYEFIRVFCMSASLPLLDDAVYRQHFAFAQLDDHASSKVSSWLKKSPSLTSDELRPPSVILLGVDTNSRMNSHRTMGKTLNFLRSLDAVELLGYTKTGENTYPNTVSFLAGLSGSATEEILNKTTDEPQDYWPYVWKDFDKAGYLTSTADDVPAATGFNYMKLGFIHKPTDFYYRPLTIHTLKIPRLNDWYVNCIGSTRCDEFLLNYLHDIFRVAQGTPVFSHSWMTTFTHECIHGARFPDKSISNFFKSMDTDNTILVFMSDHGDRKGHFRETIMGWYEDKLPTLWIHLPPRIVKRFPEWKANLQFNSRRLSSHYDLYQTLLQILRTYVPNAPRGTAEFDSERKLGQSLFVPIPENRTCDDAGIPKSYCACSEPKRVETELGRALVEEATAAAISFLHSVLPSQCAKPILDRITSGKRMKVGGDTEGFVIGFYTEPGQFLYEASVLMKTEGGKREFVVGSLEDILRMNSMTRKTDCVDNPIIERYCYCF